MTSFDFEEKLEITGLVLDESKTYSVDHDATIVEEDGTEVRIAPLDVQYQNATIWGRLITNFAGPMNNFILSILVFMLLAFLQGGVQDEDSNHFQVLEGSAVAKAGVKSNDQILKVNNYEIANWGDLTKAVSEATKDKADAPKLTITYKSGGQTHKVDIEPKKRGGSLSIGRFTCYQDWFLGQGSWRLYCYVDDYRSDFDSLERFDF
ncbi:Membrane-associated zinc metalloprotease [Streptococcus cristatus]|uniref:Membrane-associated zinc metalloprotease n=1 Tax=Streptococcus cristatus TaxID=45634 RepID=A0A139MXF5_STRCR|nr:Membrane-associated zinc metalloprotease [Streptococcus cristatus]